MLSVEFVIAFPITTAALSKPLLQSPTLPAGAPQCVVAPLRWRDEHHIITHRIITHRIVTHHFTASRASASATTSTIIAHHVTTHLHPLLQRHHDAASNSQHENVVPETAVGVNVGPDTLSWNVLIEGQLVQRH